MKPLITSLKIYFTPQRKVPKAGDRRVTKKYGLQIRVQEKAMWNGKCQGYLVRNGRPVFGWYQPGQLVGVERNYLTEEERKAYPEKKA